MKLSRRNFLKFLWWGLPAALGAGSAWKSVRETFWDLAVKHYTIATPKWPVGEPGLKIVFISDLHVGCPSVPPGRLPSIVDLANRQDADVILLGGDFLISDVIGGRYVAPEIIGPFLKGLRARYGVYSVLGNHDWWEDGNGMWDALRDQNIAVLENSSVFIPTRQGNGFWLAGLADDTTRQPDYTRARAMITDERPVIGLMHDPGSMAYVDGLPAVCFAGHTHGGQIALPFVGPLVSPSRAPLKYSYGHVTWQDRDLIVTSGIGTSVVPFRFFATPEIVVVNLENSRAA